MQRGRNVALPTVCATPQAGHHQGRWENSDDDLRTPRDRGLEGRRSSRGTGTSSAATGSSRRRASTSRTSRRSPAGAFTEVGRGTAEDIDAALDAAHAAAPAWGRTSLAERALILNRIADRIEENLETLAVAETWDNGKPVRETLAADLPLAVDHFRYFAGVLRGQEGSSSRDRREHRRLPLPRAARRGRPDHPVELPDPDGDVEARARTGGRQRRRPQAGRADAVVDPQGDGADRRPAARPACSTSSTASASRPASRSRPATGSPRSPSPARPPPAA